MREMLSPTSAIVGMKLDTTVALLTDGRFSGASCGAAIGHISPEAAAGGPIAYVKDGDQIAIDIPNYSIKLLVSDEGDGGAQKDHEVKGAEAGDRISETVCQNGILSRQRSNRRIMNQIVSNLLVVRKTAGGLDPLAVF